MLFSALSMSAKKYCHEPLTLNGGATIQLSCELISDGQYRITIEGENLAGLGGSFYNPGAVDLRNAITTKTETKIVCDIAATSAPTLYTPLYVLCPGEQNIGWPNDIDWTGTCGEGGEGGGETGVPVLENVELFGAAQNFVMLTPTATDDKGVTAYLIAKNGGAETEVIPDATTGQIKIASLTLGTTYTYTVKAKDADGNVSNAKEITFSTLDNVFCKEEVLPNPTLFFANQKLTYTAKKVSDTETYFAITSSTSTLTGINTVTLTRTGGGALPDDYVLKDGWTLKDNTLSKTVTWKTYPTSPITIAISAKRTFSTGESSLIGVPYSVDVSNTCGEDPVEPTPVESNYCQNTLTKEANSIDLTCEKVSVGNYRIIIEGSNLGQNGMDNATSGSFIIVNNEKTENITKGSLLKQYINTTLSTTSKVICEVPSTVDPKFDGNLYIMMPGEVNFGVVSDVIWGTCPEAEEDNQTPTMTSATVESYTHNSAVIAVVAEDNIGVAKYQIVDAGNSVDQTLTATDGKITLSGLASATTYNLTIYAIDKAGNKSDGLAVAAFTTDALVYCDFPTGNNGNANYGNPDGRILVSLIKITPQNVRVVVKSADAATKNLDLIYIEAAGANPHATTVGADVASSDLRVMSADISYPTIPAKYSFMIQWSNPDWNGRWEIKLNEILESNLCPLPTDEEAPVMVSASLVTGSETYNSAVLTVSATDNDEVANYHVIDATNGYDATIAPVGNQITLTGLTPSTSYNFTVTALDLAGNESENSKTVAVSTHKLEYCEWIIGSENRTDWADANRLCLLTISKITDKQLLVVAKPVSGANKLDFLQVQADGAPHQTVTSPAADELSIVLDFANTITEIPLFRILWSNEDVEENWMTDLKNVKASYLCPHIELGESVDLSKLDLSAGVTTDVKITRKFVKGSGKWNTLSLPFGLDAADIATAFGSAKVVELSGATLVTSTDIDLSVSNVSEIVAGKPYLIQIPASYAPTVIENITLSNTVTAQETATANGLAKMVSVLTPIAFDDAAGGIRFFLNTNGKLSYRSTTNGIMNPYRAYFEFPHINDPATASQVRARVVFNENTETGVDNLITTDAPAKVIENGQLIIIRGGVKYNVQGQKL